MTVDKYGMGSFEDYCLLCHVSLIIFSKILTFVKKMYFFRRQTLVSVAFARLEKKMFEQLKSNPSSQEGDYIPVNHVAW